MKLKDKRCPSCLGGGQSVNTVGFSAYVGRPLQLPCRCESCGGTGFVSAKSLNQILAEKRFRQKLLDAQRLAHAALRGQP